MCVSESERRGVSGRAERSQNKSSEEDELIVVGRQTEVVLQRVGSNGRTAAAEHTPSTFVSQAGKSSDFVSSHFSNLA